MNRRLQEKKHNSMARFMLELRAICIMLMTAVLASFLSACGQTDTEDFTEDKGILSLRQFGAMCDGMSDDSSAMLSYADYCAENGIALTVPADTSVLISSFISIKNVKNVQVMGTITAPNGIEFRANSKRTLNNWYFNVVKGNLRLSGLKSSDITVQYADELTLYADSNEPDISSIAYNKFWLGHVSSVTVQGIDKGWINENFFYGGRIKNLLFADKGDYAHNNNHFYDSTFEDAAIEFYCGKNNYIHDARFEGDISIVFHKKASNNYVQRAWVGGHVPGSLMLPSWWNDESNNNYYSYSVFPAVNTYEKTLTAYSYNYNADQAYPENGKLQIKKHAVALVQTNPISIEHAVGAVIESNEKFFRGELFLYDESGNRIDNEPEYSPIIGSGIKWKDGRYVFGDVDRRAVNLILSRNTISGGNDTGVSSVRIVINGNTAASIDYLRITVTAPWYVVLDPFSEDMLVASTAPKQGVWKDGTVCYNVGNGVANAWIYRNNKWIIF